MKGKKILATLLTFAMLLGLAGVMGASAFADEIPNITMELSDTDQQLAFIQTQAAALRQPDGENTWFYAVTDLDRNGNLEFIAASQHSRNRATNLRVWEVSADRAALTECSLAKDPEESFPDILTDAADTYHDTATDTWHYMFFDNVVLSEDEVYTVKTSVKLKGGVIDYDAYAVEHTQVKNGSRTVSHLDTTGLAISPEQYNASGSDAFAGTERSSTSFEWLTAQEVEDLARLTDSFSIFMGQKAPSDRFPVPKPAALNAAPAETAAPAAQQTYLTITKNPTNENRTEGNTAYFVSGANAYESLSWTFVSPDGGEYSAQTVQSMWGGISGQNTTTLSVSNTKTNMNGWGAYCTFYYKGQTARTTTAYMYISAKPKTPASGTYYGSVVDWNYGTVTVSVQSVTVTLARSSCDIDGDLYYGAPASVLWDGSKVVACYISGQYDPAPVYGSMYGSAYEGGGGYAIYLSNGSQVYVDSWKCSVSGFFYDGASCVVYYENYPSSENIYSVDIYGNYEDPIGTMSCPNCGARVTFDTEICPNCGFDLWGDTIYPGPDWDDGWDLDPDAGWDIDTGDDWNFGGDFSGDGGYDADLELTGFDLDF